MPLSPLSPNVKVSQGVTKNGSHDEFVGATDAAPLHTSIDSLGCENLSAQKPPIMSSLTVESQPQLSSTPTTKMGSTPESSPLSEVGSSTPPRDSPSPHVTPSTSHPPSKITSIFSAQAQDAPKPAPAPKRKRMTTEEKEKERAGKKQKQDEVAAEKTRIAAEKEAVKAEKAAEKAKADVEKEANKATKAAEKAKADAAKEAKRMKKQEDEANKAAKAAEKAKADAAKEAKRLKRQGEELAAQSKKEKQQNLMASFLKKPPTTPSKTSTHPATISKADTTSPSVPKEEAKPTKTAYELNFKPFFVKAGVTMAPSLQMDNETKEAKEAILDEYVRGDRGEYAPKRPFDAVETFDLAFPQQRGIIPPSVKKIMERIHGDQYQNNFSLTSTRSESQTEKLFNSAQDDLENVPMKYIRFYEDVRPAYYGTATTPMTYHKLRALSRRPAGRILPLAYDYDSEAEWVEDDGEDLDDAEDEEEDVEGDEEMDDFVDDSEADPTIIRPGFENDSLPVSTGVCFENRKRLGPSNTVYKYRLEFILDSLEHHSMINPFSTEYWPSPAKKAVAATATSSSTQGTLTSMLPPSAPRDRDVPSAAACPAATSDVKDGIPRDLLQDFKRALLSDKCKDYSKATVIEMLAKKFTSCTKAQVKVTLDAIAHRVTPAGEKKSVKIWVLLPGFGLEEN
ncbi:chromatin assembly factor 1 subunit A-domain-containing protein [Xylaria arbuscula]|nr:chromatin assembly factor 1 subunit A-domain-containing protein [Xylaria arbuscula]